MQIFSADATMFLKNQYCPGCSNSPKAEIPYRACFVSSLSPQYFNPFFLLHILGVIYESSVTSNDLVTASKAIIALQTRETNLVVST